MNSLWSTATMQICGCRKVSQMSGSLPSQIMVHKCIVVFKEESFIAKTKILVVHLSLQMGDIIGTDGLIWNSLNLYTQHIFTFGFAARLYPGQELWLPQGHIANLKKDWKYATFFKIFLIWRVFESLVRTPVPLWLVMPKFSSIEERVSQVSCYNSSFTRGFKLAMIPLFSIGNKSSFSIASSGILLTRVQINNSSHSKS
jgi:hypothetical protein